MADAHDQHPELKRLVAVLVLMLYIPSENLDASSVLRYIIMKRIASPIVMSTPA